jgi:hypothetical protein
MRKMENRECGEIWRSELESLDRANGLWHSAFPAIFGFREAMGYPTLWQEVLKMVCRKLINLDDYFRWSEMLRSLVGVGKAKSQGL